VTHHILLAEDFPQFMQRLIALLEPAGLNIAQATNGADAIDYVCETSKPLHLLITDLDMPRRTGWQVIEAVRRHRSPDLPIIMQTGEASYPWVKVKAHELGIILIDKLEIEVKLLPAVLTALRLDQDP
jgi:CheY-like chemotaxis protein